MPIQAFVLTHESRFRPIDEAPSIPRRDLVGYTDAEHYYFTESGLKEACHGYAVREVLRLLARRGWLTHEAGRLTKRVMVAEVGRLHLYAVSRAMVEDDPNDEGDPLVQLWAGVAQWLTA